MAKPRVSTLVLTITLLTSGVAAANFYVGRNEERIKRVWTEQQLQQVIQAKQSLERERDELAQAKQALEGKDYFAALDTLQAATGLLALKPQDKPFTVPLPVYPLLLVLAAVLAATKVGGELVRRAGQPTPACCQ